MSVDPNRRTDDRSECNAARHTEAMARRIADDPSGGHASYWLRRAAMNLDCAVQCCGTDESGEIDAMESRCDELATLLKERDGN